MFFSYNVPEKKKTVPYLHTPLPKDISYNFKSIHPSIIHQRIKVVERRYREREDHSSCVRYHHPYMFITKFFLRERERERDGYRRYFPVSGDIFAKYNIHSNRGEISPEIT